MVQGTSFGIGAASAQASTYDLTQNAMGAVVDQDEETQALCQEFVEKLRIPTFDEDAHVVLSQLAQIVESAIDNPTSAKHRSIQLDSEATMKIVDKFPQALEYLEIIGFKKATPQEYSLPEDKASASSKTLRTGLQVLNKAMLNLDDIHIETNDQKESSPSVSDTFRYDRALVTRLNQGMPPPGDKNALLEQKVAEMKEIERQKLIAAASSISTNRQLSVFEKCDEASSRDNFPSEQKSRINRVFSKFTGTDPDDLLIPQAVFQDVINLNKKRAKEYEGKEQKEESEVQDKRPQFETTHPKEFETKAMREMKYLSKRKLYTETTIKVQFPDDLVIEAKFSPLETIADVEAQVMKCMTNPEKDSVKFYLFERPKNARLAPEAQLKDLNLVPRARLYVGWESKRPEGEYIKDELLQQTRRGA